MKQINNNNTYSYRLTEWLKEKGELGEVIKQIEQYEGKGKGYYLGTNPEGQWAVFTKGDMVVKKPDVSSHRNQKKTPQTILQYRDILRRM